MSSEVGTVISTLEGPTTMGFSFVISSPKVRKGQFVQAKCEEGLLVGMVTEITRANRYFERAESVAEYERSGGMPNFPTAEWEYVIANVRALGVYSGTHLIRSTFPVAPGIKVEIAEEELLKDFLGFAEGGLNLGKLANHELDALLPLNGLFQKHLSILAMSGAGKSYLSSVMIEELLDRKPENGRIAVIVIDVHGEYLGFKGGSYGQKTKIYDGKKLRVALHKVSPQMLGEFLPELSAPQKRDVAVIMGEMKKEAKEKGEAYDMNDLMKRVEANAGIKESVKGTLLAWLSELGRLRLFGKADNPPVNMLALPGNLSILDLSEIDSMKKKQIIVAYFAKKLFAARRKGKIPPFLLLVEESHNFAREKAPKGSSISKHAIETIAREGRKFGASLCLVSQRPVQLSTTALSQCNTNIILRVTNPYDIDHIGESCEGIDKAMLGAITTLRVGEALVVGEAVHYPIFIKVRKRKSKSSPKGENLEILAKQFEELQGKKEKDVEAFL
ncbi:MAG: ATP-binding protein [Candidatus Micrarchaeota archaeon]